MIVEKIQKAISIISKRAELLVSANLHSRTESYDVASGSVISTSNSVPVKGVFEQFDIREIDNLKVFQDDIKFIVLVENGLSVNSLNDKIEIDGIDYDIIKYRNINVGTTKILYVLHLRR